MGKGWGKGEKTPLGLIRSTIPRLLEILRPSLADCPLPSFWRNLVRHEVNHGIAKSKDSKARH